MAHVYEGKPDGRQSANTATPMNLLPNLQFTDRTETLTPLGGLVAQAQPSGYSESNTAPSLPTQSKDKST